jgi:hypothetical protein
MKVISTGLVNRKLCRSNLARLAACKSNDLEEPMLSAAAFCHSFAKKPMSRDTKRRMRLGTRTETTLAAVQRLSTEPFFPRVVDRHSSGTLDVTALRLSGQSRSQQKDVLGAQSTARLSPGDRFLWCGCQLPCIIRVRDDWPGLNLVRLFHWQLFCGLCPRNPTLFPCPAHRGEIVLELVRRPYLSFEAICTLIIAVTGHEYWFRHYNQARIGKRT